MLENCVHKWIRETGDFCSGEDGGFKWRISIREGKIRVQCQIRRRDSQYVPDKLIFLLETWCRLQTFPV